ncbi:hypothetical protein PVAP13_2KG413300 [Panicum virgatum]|uniref:Uncharacterized protein n=1 Tax=Panicum virgatum TaxID=38727 RepID=A0A8T0WIH0_PANVG|nr:hypothetical protein PVAP13_2KG413300 [Panicum virgatum]
MRPTRFRMPLPEDPSPDPDPYATFRSLVRVISEFGFVSSIIAGICIQRNGMIHQTSPAAAVTKLLVLVAGTAASGANILFLYDDSVFAPKYPNLAPLVLPQRRRRIVRARRRQGSG